MYKILIVEDDPNISSLLQSHIQKYGYEAIVADNFDDIMISFNNVKPHLVLLDVNLPKFDGFYWCRQIRHESTCPIVFISARAGEMEQIMAIESGADDYITKPFHYDVVMAKIKGQLRRIYGDYAPSMSERIVEVEGLKLYPERPELHFRNEQVLLTKKEAILAEMLLSKYPRTANREDLLSALWDDESFVEENTLNVNITRLRKKFTELGIENAIETVRGLGYRFNTTWSE
ncbi:DNA-binding response regulator [Bacillus sp. AFS018417]|uniref:Response regulator protein GraR n=1 Tax=Bacillus rhizoplanae TaxID=2880966 RepID=A0ABN7ZYS4_9BACI|nr:MULTISPECIES: response regulator transcription factor [Bacillus]MCP1125712.1 response regulator transcription factor [Bacillus sp. 3103sda1]PEZ08878.1 DNA-binding response regulator [Bacillus sp. AFS018417]PGZ99140.1 DNA-binding response regulator [Bacillus pseudomycoides]CAG9614054.1 Response regulator protein GraR [Bacillus rhizoplanae]